MKIARGKMFTPFCFFYKITLNHVHFDLKGSTSNSNSGQCKFDLRSMAKASKLCQVTYHLTRLDETKVLILLCSWLLWIKRQLQQVNEMLRTKKVFLMPRYIAKKRWRHFWTCDFSKFYASWKKTNAIFGILRKF